MAHITTHVLDTARGAPAAGVVVTLHVLERSERRLLASTTTNGDGRTNDPLLAADTIPIGQYEITFFVGDYFRARGDTLASPAFLDDVVIRVGIADAHGRYHVPLLVSPYGYSTYRGS
jgi:5-hydroxyisourate hydrolase